MTEQATLTDKFIFFPISWTPATQFSIKLYPNSNKAVWNSPIFSNSQVFCNLSFQYVEVLVALSEEYMEM